MHRLFPAGLLVGLMPAFAPAQAPTLSHALPAAVPPGKAVDVVLHGANLAGATSLWSSKPIASELTPGVDQNGKQPASVSYRLTVPPETPLGLVGIRVTTGNGVSNLRLLLIDDLASVVKAGNNKTLQTAQPLSVPAAVDGACDAESSDFYKITVAAGQRLSFDVFARRLGYPLDPMMRLLDASGRELAFSDDEPSSGADSRFSHTFVAAGDYYVELRDIRYQGGGNHRYRLRIGDFPLSTVPYPLAVQRGTSANVQLTGNSAETPVNVAVNMPTAVPGDRLNVSTALAPGQGSSWFTVLASDTPEQLEQEPNDSPEASTQVKLPGAIDGRFERRGDRDFYQFEAHKGDRFLFTGQTRSLGSPCDLFMRLYNAEGGVLAEADDTAGDEGVLNVSIPADGVYRLRVEDHESSRWSRRGVSHRRRAVSARLLTGRRGRKGQLAAEWRLRRQSDRHAPRLQRPDHAGARRHARRHHAAAQCHSRG